jgi:carbohydrate-selective porin OprB
MAMRLPTATAESFFIASETSQESARFQATRLTGDWNGLRDDMSAKGVVLDVDLLVAPMDNLFGGKNTGGETCGNADYTLNVDTQKLGMWPGGLGHRAYIRSPSSSD